VKIFFPVRYAVCPCLILVMCGLSPGDYNLTSGCHGESKPTNFSLPVCFPTGEAGKNARNQPYVVFSELPQYKSMGGNGLNFDLYSEGEFFKNRSF
jgi:hypothetical protein